MQGVKEGSGRNRLGVGARRGGRKREMQSKSTRGGISSKEGSESGKMRAAER